MILKCNPFYEFLNGQDKIEVIDYFTKTPKYQINTSAVQSLYNGVIKKLLDEKKDLNEVIGEYSEKTGDNISQLISSLGNVLINAEGKEALFYERLFKLIGQVKDKYPGLHTENLKKFLEESILTADVYIFYNIENERLLDEFDLFPFRNLNCMEINSVTFEQIRENVNSAGDNDWILILADNLQNEKIQYINLEVIKQNKKMFIIQINPQKEILGPILVPNSTGCINCISESEFDEKTVDFKKEYAIEEGKSYLEDIIHTNVYDEILNYSLDLYSNFSTEYSFFIGTQYEFDFKKKTIRRREVCKNANCISC